VKKLCIILGAISFFLFTPYQEAFPFEGPLQLRNQFPPFLIADPPYLENASYDNYFSASLSYSSTFMVRNSDKWSVNIDLETTELNLRYKRVVADFIELGVDLPILSFNSGFMDDFLESYHDTFGFSDYGRSGRPENQFLYELKKDGDIVIKGRSGRIGIGDIRLTAKKAVLKGDPCMSVTANIEFPTGQASAGFGNGSIDGGVAILIDKNLGEKVKTYFNFGAVFPGDLEGNEVVGLRNFLYGGAGIEVAPWKSFSLLGQVMFQSSPFQKTGISSMDRVSALLALGARYSSGKNSLELSLTEDPNTAGAPDFVMNLSYKRRF
jgi:hypothetical protein